MNKNINVSIEARKMLLQYLTDLAEKKGITQEQIAERTGFQQSNISRMFSGKYSPSLDNFISLAQACECFIFVIDKESDSDITKSNQPTCGL